MTAPESSRPAKAMGSPVCGACGIERPTPTWLVEQGRFGRRRPEDRLGTGPQAIEVEPKQSERREIRSGSGASPTSGGGTSFLEAVGFFRPKYKIKTRRTWVPRVVLRVGGHHSEGALEISRYTAFWRAVQSQKVGRVGSRGAGTGNEGVEAMRPISGAERPPLFHDRSQNGSMPCSSHHWRSLTVKSFPLEPMKFGSSLARISATSFRTACSGMTSATRS